MSKVIIEREVKIRRKGILGRFRKPEVVWEPDEIMTREQIDEKRDKKSDAILLLEGSGETFKQAAVISPEGTVILRTLSKSGDVWDIRDASIPKGEIETLPIAGDADMADSKVTPVRRRLSFK